MEKEMRKMRLLVLAVLVSITLVAGGMPVLSQAECDDCPMGAMVADPGACDTSFIFDGVGDTEVLTYSTPKCVDLEISLRDCCIRDDVVEVRINGAHVWTVDSCCGDYGTHPCQKKAFTLCPGMYTIELKLVQSSAAGGSGWYYGLTTQAPTPPCDVKPPAPVKVGIDIHPGGYPNAINLKAKKGVVPVAILGSPKFDVKSVMVKSIVFGPAMARPAHDLTDPAVYMDHLQDVNGDGFVDLVVHFSRPDTGIKPGMTSAALMARVKPCGCPIMGMDSIVTVPPS
jgi:hypothetical protein